MKKNVRYGKILKELLDLWDDSEVDKTAMNFHEVRVQRALYNIAKMAGYKHIKWIDKEDSVTRWNGGGGP